MKKWLLFASVMCIVFVIAACGTNKSTNNAAEQEVTTAVADSGAASSELVITASNWEFDQKEYKIKAGETVNVTLKSIDGVHGIQIPKTDYEIGNGKTVPVSFTEAGTYELICNVQCGAGHRQMKTTLVVE